MAFTDINSEDRLVQETFADHLEKVLGWDSVYAWNQETFGPDGTLGRSDTRDVVLVRDLRAAIELISADDAIASLALRVRWGGHHVADAVVRRRVVAGRDNFHAIYRARVDYWQLYDNSGEEPLLLDEGHNP